MENSEAELTAQPALPHADTVNVLTEHYYKKIEPMKWKVPAQTTMKDVLRMITKKMHHRLQAQGHRYERECINFNYKKSRKEANENATVKERHQELKDQNGFLTLSYYFSCEFQGDIPTGTEFALLFLALPIIIPTFATLCAYDWAAKNIKQLPLPSLPSLTLPELRLPTFSKKTHKFEFKAKKTLSERRRMFENNQGLYPQHILLIVERHQNSLLPALPFFKFSVQRTLTFRHFCAMMQARIAKAAVTEEEFKQSLFFLIANQIPAPETTMEDLYAKYLDEDGMLYVVYQEQQSF